MFFLDEEINVIFNCFRKLGYPNWFIDKAHFKARKSYYCPSVRLDVNSKPDVILPYCRSNDGLMLDLKKVDVKAAFNYPCSIGTILSNTSQKSGSHSQKGVYCVPCLGCEQVYIGETGRSVDQRLREHKYAARRGDNNNALFMHMSTNDHLIDWQNTEMLYKTSNLHKRKIVEAALIQSVPNYNLNEGNYKFDRLLSTYVIQAASLEKKVKELNN